MYLIIIKYNLTIINNYLVIIKYNFKYFLSYKIIILISNICITNENQSNTILNVYILKYIKNYNKIHIFQMH